MEVEVVRSRLPVSVSVGVFISDNQGRLLMVQQAAPEKGYKWGVPAGGMEAKEDPKMAAIREAEEEIGARIRLLDVIGVYTISRGPNRSGMAVNFRANIVDGIISPRVGEILQAKYCTPAELSKMSRVAEIYKPEYNLPAIDDWLSGQSFPLEVIRNLRTI